MISKPLQTLEEAQQAFLAYSPPGMKGKYQLGRMRQLMEFLGSPQERLKVVHIAGTSGKTSTAYFIRGMLEAAGQRTGLTISPHIAGINERVQIGGMPLEAERFLSYVSDFLHRVEQTNLRPTYFELLIALAYLVFAEENVDYAIVETGLGGLLDGTNVVSRSDKVCVITDIGLDHTEILGETLAEIAMQKAGVIQPHNHVLMHEQASEVMQIVRQTVKTQQATLELAKATSAPKGLPLFQKRNWELAEAAFKYLKNRDGLQSLTSQQKARAVSQTPPGRWELYRFKDKTIILDGAHNPQKLQALSESLKARGIHSAAVLANLVEAPDAKITASLSILKPFTSHLIVPEFSAGQDLKSRRSLRANELAELAQSTGFAQIQTEPNLEHALQLLLSCPEKTLLITGSLYLVSALRPFVMKVCFENATI